MKKNKNECPNCKEQNEEGVKFCAKCGTKLPEMIICKECGKEHLDTDLVCPKCGYSGKSSKKGLIITLSILGGVLLIGIIILIIVLAGGSSKSNSGTSGSGNPGGGSSGSPTQPGPKATVNVKAAETKTIQYETVSNNYFSMQIPKGWKVETVGNLIHFGIRAYNPNDNRYQIFMYLKMEPLLANTQAKNIFNNLYANSGDRDYQMFSYSTALQSLSTLGFFQSFMDHVGFIYGDYGSQYYGNINNHQFPVLYNLKVVDTANPKYNGGGQDEKILRLNFTVPLSTGEELKGQGLFTASVMPPAYIQRISGIDVTPRLVYEVSGISSAEDDFINWEPILLNCLKSLKYTDAFISATEQASISEGQAARNANQKIQNAYDSYNAAWSNRQKSYDVTSQKNSDATLSYDRVKDPDTGEIYRAESGWYDSYDLNRDKFNKSNLQLVTSDSDYLEPISGYIYK
jgi:hypothetical protein